ncbi:MAG TPA: hypothetical protein VJS66_03140 [Burkholderiales bacterium]|nr:hypothetical protein [Burkholderiales bacterium]
MQAVSGGLRRGAARRGGCVALLLAATYSSLAASAEWYVEPMVKTEFESNDNRALTTGPHERVNGVVFDVSGLLGRRTERSELRFAPRLRSARYSGDEDLDSDDTYLDGLWSYRATERSSASLNANYTRNSTLTTEQADIGLVTAKKRRRTWNVNPSWSTLLDERNMLTLSFARTDVDYRDAQDTALTSYTYDRVDTTWTRQMTPSTDTGVTLYGSQLETPATGNTTTDAGLQFNLNHRPFETARLNVAAGWHRSEFEQEAGGSTFRGSETGWLASFTAEREAERSALRFNASRSINPSGVGSLVRTDEVTLSWYRALTALQSASVAIRTFRTEPLDERLTSDNRRFWRGDARWNWRASEDWSLSAGYQHTRQRQEAASEIASSNAISLTLMYVAPSRAISR